MSGESQERGVSRTSSKGCGYITNRPSSSDESGLILDVLLGGGGIVSDRISQ